MVTPAVLRGITVARRFMAAGLVASLFGSSIANGLVPGAVVLGAVALFWIPLLQTVEAVEDLLSPFAARLVGGFNPAHVLVAVEVFILVCAVTAMGLVMLGLSPWLVLMGYLLVTSVGPLLIDVAEEMFAGQLARLSEDVALSFNVQIYVAIGVFSTLIARPLGTSLAGAPMSVIFALCALAAGIALSLRLSGVGYSKALLARRAGPSVEDDGATVPIFGDQHAVDEKSDSEVKSSGLSTLFHRGDAGSPLVSGLGGLAAAIPATYVALSLTQGLPGAQGVLAWVMVAVGVGATVGPLFGKRLARHGYRPGLRYVMIGRAVILIGLLIVEFLTDRSLPFVILGSVLLALLGALTAATAVLQATARQVSLVGDELRSAVGWSHSMFAGGALLGGWIGLLSASLRIEITIALAIVATIVCFSVLFVRSDHPSVHVSAN